MGCDPHDGLAGVGVTPARRAAETAWSKGDRLAWSGERWTFWQFDPDYPRAICQSDSLRVCAIDITSAKRIDPATERKRAERQRRKEGGYKRVECWLSPAAMEALTLIQKMSEKSVADCINDSIIGTGAAYEWLNTEPDNDQPDA